MNTSDAPVPSATPSATPSAELETTADTSAGAAAAPAAAGAPPVVEATPVASVAPRPTLSYKRLFFFDLSCAAAAALVGSATVAATELVLALCTAQGKIRPMAGSKFAVLDAALVSLVALALVPISAFLLVLLRGSLMLIWPTLARRLWLGARSKEAPPFSGVAPWIVSLGMTATLYVAASYGLTRFFTERFREAQLIALALACLQIGLFAFLGLLSCLLAAGLRHTGRALHRWLGAFNPLGRPGMALVLLAVGYAPLVVSLLRRMPQLGGALPWRELLSAGALVLGWSFGLRLRKRRPPDPQSPRRSTKIPRRRWILVAAMVSWVALGVPVALWKIGADPETKFLAVTASPTLNRLVGLVRWANDFDGDGYGSLLGENDCAPFDGAIHPNARDIPDNGIDENCSGRDFSPGSIPSYRQGETTPVPDEYRRRWSFLFITIDTVRYDHTGIGGYFQKRKRNTTPNLDKLATRAVSFTFANAPSAGTVASIPAILMSKFFHSGIALEESNRRGELPKIKPENTTIAEAMKRGGYRTVGIGSHYYFNNWGLEQGFDTFDNSLGAKPEPFCITSQAITDKVQSWIAKLGKNPWFIWAHYIDPHGRYVAHPGDVQFGAEEEDLYDGELAYTDKHVGRLLDYLTHSPAAATTVVTIVSDHGDGFKEHGFINHGMALYRELLHVPLIVYIPDIEPRSVDGPVSPLDLFPTVAQLAGIDISDLSLEGESLVPQLFYRRDANQRVVFAETNWPEPLRAAITQDYKLIYNLKANVFQLFNLKTDPWEKQNLWN
ncbi:MAG: sulfatase-like hydrolase/transferase, partial [Pseudomonadota bacterium]